MGGKDIALVAVSILLVASVASTIYLAIVYTELLDEQSSSNHGSDDVYNSTYVRPKDRINCFPEEGPNEWFVTKDQCEKRGCTFELDQEGDGRVPICYMHPDKVGYRVAKVNKDDEYFLSLTLEPLTNTAVFDPPIQSVTFKAKVWSSQHVQIKIEDANEERYQVPFEPSMTPSNGAISGADFEIEYKSNPFSFNVRRKSTGAKLFDTSMGGFVFSDRFLQITSRLPSQFFYGLGEHEHDSLRHDLDNYNTWPIFARDQGGLGVGTNLYGTHPFYMVMENDGNSHGVFLMNSNAMEYSMIPAPGFIIRTIGGIFDFHVYTGPTPGDVIIQHTEFVGRPFIPPYWALGFQLSKYGYDNLTNMQAAINRTRDAGIPLDVIYADIDSFDARKDFTYDQVNFKGLNEYFANELATEGLRSVTILDPAIPNTKDYEPWTKFNDAKAYITWENDTNMIGYVWPDDKVAFPDFFKTSAKNVWIDLIVEYMKTTLKTDGIWIDMNEPANFGTNEEKPFNWPNDMEPWSLKCPESYYDDPPYRTC